MKGIVIISAIIAFTTFRSLAQETPKKEPDQLVKLRAAWQRSVSQIVAPLNEKYREGLVKMKTDFSRAGNLEAALAVDAEIKDFDALENKEVLGNWRIIYTNGRSYNREVLKDGTWKDGTWKDAQNAERGKTWKVEGDRIVFNFPDGGKDWFFLPIDPKQTKGKNIQGDEFTAVRERN